jgi:glucosyl-3-phosphoglycerate phosphatase
MILLRHGQSWFNLHFSATRVDPGIEDPELTEMGQAQAQAAASVLAAQGGTPITRIIVSPYTRALQTVEPVRRLLPGATVEVMHEVRERAAFACDVGSHPDVLAARFPQHEFAHLPPRWWHEGLEPEAAVIERANAFRDEMAAREDAVTTLLVSHWAFILALTGTSVANGEMLRYDPRAAAPERIVWRV